MADPGHERNRVTEPPQSHAETPTGVFGGPWTGAGVLTAVRPAEGMRKGPESLRPLGHCSAVPPLGERPLPVSHVWALWWSQRHGRWSERESNPADPSASTMQGVRTDIDATRAVPALPNPCRHGP